MIVSVGAGYSGIPKWKFTTDVRYVNFSNTVGTARGGFKPDGSIKGPGWRSIWAVASGVQYQATEKFSIRTGYAYNQSPVRPINTAFTLGSPSVTQHSVSTGFSYQFNPHMAFAAAYEYAFAGSSTGPLQSLNGPVPNSSINLKTSLNSFSVGLIVRF
jgi:long-chain fatty acid transport protein